MTQGFPAEVQHEGLIFSINQGKGKEASKLRLRSFFSPSSHHPILSPISSAWLLLIAMALIQSTLIWVVYAVVLVLLLAIASIFVYLYQTPRERSATVTVVCIITLTSLLATVLLLPVDIALISSTTSSSLGRRKDWATDDRVDSIVYTLKIVYYTLYSVDAVLCLIVVPFTYFWYEEYDEVATEEGNQTLGSRFWGAFKYTIGFILLVVLLFVIGFFVPVAKDRRGGRYDLDYFRHILTENRKSSMQFS